MISIFGLRKTSKPRVFNVNGDFKHEGSNHSYKSEGSTFGLPKGAASQTQQISSRKVLKLCSSQIVSSCFH
jgi:hypothetical protein